MRLLFSVHKWSNSGNFIWISLIEATEVGNVSALGTKGKGVLGMISRFLGK